MGRTREQTYLRTREQTHLQTREQINLICIFLQKYNIQFKFKLTAY